MQFSPLSDLTSYVQNNDNVQRQQRYKPSAAPVVVAEPASPLSRSGRTHNPYGAQVLSVRYHAPTPAYAPLPPPPPPPMTGLLNLSSESATSSNGSVSASPTFIVRTPVRREYRNGRPVPIFTNSQ